MSSAKMLTIIWAAIAAVLVMPPTLGADQGKPELLVFAAASLTDVMGELGADFTKQSQQPVKFSFAASSALARQIEAGARAGVFVSADLEWMDYLQSRNLIDKTTRRNVVGNRLVLIAPAASTVTLDIGPDFPLRQTLGNARLATGDPDIVPVGRYARSALTSLGVWNEIADRLVRADNVRSALAFVSRGEAPLGVVYETDAKVEKRVRVVDVFPADSHPPITYPMAVVKDARGGSVQFVQYLSTPAAQSIFQKFGFQPPPQH